MIRLKRTNSDDIDFINLVALFRSGFKNQRR